MTVSGLQPGSFSAYPPRAREFTVSNLDTLRRLPLPLLPILLRELSSFDWRFPREQARLRSQMEWLSSMPAPEFARITLPFSNIQVPAIAAAKDWANDPSSFIEALTASLWSSQQVSSFQDAARGYSDAFANARPAPAPARRRFTMVVLSRDLGGNPAPALSLPTKLRRSALALTNVDPINGMALLHEHLQQRAAHAAEPFAHWHIDGVSAAPISPAVTSISYADLEPARQVLLARARQAMSAERSGPEELRSLMARLTPGDIGSALGDDPTLARFQLSLLTEGSGTQVFATTFVQWAARECLRRAEPETLLVRFTARQRQQGMNELLSGAPSTGEDPAGSLQDAQMGAYYTWLNVQRLPGAEHSRFLLWQEGRSSALVTGPGLPRGTTSSSRMDMQQILKFLA